MTWKLAKLGEICDFQGGSQPSKSNFTYEKKKNYVRFIQIRDFKSNNNITYIPSSKKNRYCTQDDILIGRYGASVGKILTGLSGAYNVALMKTIPKQEIIDKKYLYLYLSSELFQKPLIKISDRSAQNGFSKDDIFDFKVPIPSLKEQQQIVTKIHSAFVEIDKASKINQKKIDNINFLSAKVINDLIYEMLSKNNLKKLSDVCYKITKGSSPKWQGISYMQQPGILFITSENVGNNELRMNKTKYVEEKFNEKEKKSILQKGDVLTNIVGASIGRTAVFDLEDVPPANINQAVCVMRTNQEKLNPYFLSYLLNSELFSKTLHSGETSTARANISLGFISNLEIPLPNLDEQNKFLTKCKNFYNSCSNLISYSQEQRELFEKLKSSIFKQELQPNKAA